MKNFVQPGHALAVVAPSGGLVSGQAVLIGNLFGVAAYSALAGASAEIVVTGVFTLPKASGVTFTAGAKAYWDNAAFDITSVSSGNLWVGLVTDSSVASGAATVDVRLNGFGQ